MLGKCTKKTNKKQTFMRANTLLSSSSSIVSSTSAIVPTTTSKALVPKILTTKVNSKQEQTNHAQASCLHSQHSPTAYTMSLLLIHLTDLSLVRQCSQFAPCVIELQYDDSRAKFNFLKILPPLVVG